MSTPAPRPTTARLLQVGDTISVSAPDGEMHIVTIAALDDDEPNRRILITARNDATGQTGTVNAAPGDKFDRLAQPDDLRETVIVDATDYWKWIGTHINHPNNGPSGHGEGRATRPASQGWPRNRRDCPRKRPTSFLRAHRTPCV
jgi:hypothetical protein